MDSDEDNLTSNSVLVHSALGSTKSIPWGATYCIEIKAVWITRTPLNLTRMEFALELMMIVHQLTVYSSVCNNG